MHCPLLCHRRLEVERSGTGRRQWRRSRFRRWRSVAKTAVGADRVVMPPPGFDQHLGLGEAVEDIAIEQFVAKRPVEAFGVDVLPWRRRGGVKRLTRLEGGRGGKECGRKEIS